MTSFYVTQTTPTFGYAVLPATSRAYFQAPDDEQVFVVDANGARPWDVAGVVAVNADATEIYAFDTSISGPLQRRSVSTGAVLATANVTAPGNVLLVRDPRSGHIWFANGGRVRVLDGSTLATIAERGFTFGSAQVKLAFDPDRPIAYIGWKATYEADNLPAHFVVLNTDTMAIEAEADVATASSCRTCHPVPTSSECGPPTAPVKGPRRTRLPWSFRQPELSAIAVSRKHEGHEGQQGLNPFMSSS